MTYCRFRNKDRAAIRELSTVMAERPRIIVEATALRLV